jgi:hypothetical protein
MTTECLKRASWCPLLAALAIPRIAAAADTMETPGEGNVDMEVYLQAGGLGLAAEEQIYGLCHLITWGVTERISPFVGIEEGTNPFIEHAEGGPLVGLLATPLDTDHVDLDLVVHFHLAGRSFLDVQTVPGFELNFDLRPDLALWGLYVAGCVPMGARAGDGRRMDVAVELYAGTYVTLARIHQLLLETDIVIDPLPWGGDPVFDYGGVSVGYNVFVHEQLELITQLRVDVPTHGEQAAVDLMVGAIVSFGA